MEHMNIRINLSEHFPPNKGETLTLDYGDFTVESMKPVYVAESVYGRSFAGTTEKALSGAKTQIEKALRGTDFASA